MKTTREEVEEFIAELHMEADALDEIGSSYGASQYRKEAERLQKLLDRGIIPQQV